MSRRADRTERIQRIIERAESYLGLRSRPHKDNQFGTLTGHNGKDWNGSFLETVLTEENLYAGTVLTSTVAALGYFLREGLVVRPGARPRPGDLAFYAWSEADQFSQPHVGLVTSVSKDEWKSSGVFRTVEGQVNPGTARGHWEPDGVYRRTRFSTDVLAFVRPVYRERPHRAEPISLPELQVLLHRGVRAFNMIPGKLDSQTRSAVRRMNAEIGVLDVNGEPSTELLQVASGHVGLEP